MFLVIICYDIFFQSFLSSSALGAQKYKHYSYLCPSGCLLDYLHLVGAFFFFSLCFSVRVSPTALSSNSLICVSIFIQPESRFLTTHSSLICFRFFLEFSVSISSPEVGEHFYSHCFDFSGSLLISISGLQSPGFSDLFRFFTWAMFYFSALSGSPCFLLCFRQSC